MTNDNKILPPEWEVPPIFRTRLGEQAGRQRLMTEAGHLLLILHAPPSPEVNERQAKIFWRSPKGEWKAANTKIDGLKALQQHLHQYGYVVEQLENQLDQAKRAEEFFAILRALAPLLRAIRNLHHTLQQAREKFETVRELIILRDQAYQLERTSELLDAEAKHALNFMLAQQAEEQTQNSEEIAEASYRLNLLASLFLPVTALATIFSMNFPETMKTFDSFLTFGGVLLIGMILGYRLKRKLQKPMTTSKKSTTPGIK